MIGQRKRFGGIVGRLAAATVGPRRSYGGLQKVMMPQKKPARKHLPFSWWRSRMRWEDVTACSLDLRWREMAAREGVER